MLAPCVRIALGACTIATASCLHAAGLFLPVGPADVAPGAKSASVRQSASLHSGRAWERRVRIARQDLTAARDDVESVGQGRLLLNVRDGVRLNVVVERTAPTKYGYSLSGRVAGKGVGFVTLVVHEDAVAGAIWTPEAEYELHYVGGGVHALRDVTNAPPFECAGGTASELSSADSTGQDRADDWSVVDILVVWTPYAKESAGGESQILSRIEMHVALLNDALERSGALVSLNLVGAEEVDYATAVTEDGYADLGLDLSRLINPDDGYMDGVHDRRDALGADLVYMEDSTGGVASRTHPFALGVRAYAFRHEVGHLFGIAHERYEFLSGTIGYQHGFTTERCSISTMSYGRECRYARARVPFFASPWRYGLGDGRALGVTRFSKERGARGPADAVLTVNRNRHRIANLRPSRARE